MRVLHGQNAHVGEARTFFLLRAESPRRSEATTSCNWVLGDVSKANLDQARRRPEARRGHSQIANIFSIIQASECVHHIEADMLEFRYLLQSQ
jgi:hypothetical protein